MENDQLIRADGRKGVGFSALVRKLHQQIVLAIPLEMLDYGSDLTAGEPLLYEIFV